MGLFSSCHVLRKFGNNNFLIYNWKNYQLYLWIVSSCYSRPTKIFFFGKFLTSFFPRTPARFLLIKLFINIKLSTHLPPRAHTHDYLSGRFIVLPVIKVGKCLSINKAGTEQINCVITYISVDNIERLLKFLNDFQKNIQLSGAFQDTTMGFSWYLLCSINRKVSAELVRTIWQKDGK